MVSARTVFRHHGCVVLVLYGTIILYPRVGKSLAGPQLPTKQKPCKPPESFPVSYPKRCTGTTVQTTGWKVLAPPRLVDNTMRMKDLEHKNTKKMKF